MFLRWLIKHLCKNATERRLMLRLLHAYLRCVPEERQHFQIKDKRIRRSLRLSALWAGIALQLDTPLVPIIGLVSMIGLIGQGIFHFITRMH